MTGVDAGVPDTGDSNPPPAKDAGFDSPDVGFGDPTKGTISGRLVAVDNTVLADGEIWVAGRKATTDQSGRFLVSGLEPGMVIVQGTDSGFSNGFVRAEVIANEVTEVTILTSRSDIVPFRTPATGGTWTGREGAAAEFSAGGFRYADGTPLTDMSIFRIGHAVLDSVLELAAAPGGWQAMAPNGDLTPIEPYGALQLWLIGRNDEVIEWAQTATVAIPTSSGRRPGPNDTIRLYNFDASVGYWRDVGGGVNEGTYVDTHVDDVGWWAIGRPLTEIGCIKGRLVDNAGQPLGDVPMIVRGNNWTGGTHERSGSDGTYCANVKLDAVSAVVVNNVSAMIDGELTVTENSGRTAGTCAMPANCVDMGDQTVMTSARMCVVGRYGPGVEDAQIRWSVLDNGGVSVETGAFDKSPSDPDGFCFGAGYGASVEFTPEGVIDCTDTVAAVSIAPKPGSCGKPSTCVDVGIICK